MLFRKKIEPSCNYCRSGVALGFGDIICKKRGIVSENGSCRSFYYEPTRREPEYARYLKTPDISSGTYDLFDDA